MNLTLTACGGGGTEPATITPTTPVTSLITPFSRPTALAPVAYAVSRDTARFEKTYSFKNEGKLRGTLNGARLCHQINTYGLASESFASGTQLTLASAGKVYALNDAHKDPIFKPISTDIPILTISLPTTATAGNTFEGITRTEVFNQHPGSPTVFDPVRISDYFFGESGSIVAGAFNETGIQGSSSTVYLHGGFISEK